MCVLRSTRHQSLGSNSNKHLSRLEPLEVRQLLSAVTESSSHDAGEGAHLSLAGAATHSHAQNTNYVSDDPTASHIVLQHDTIPNFVLNPTHTSVQSGNWSDPQTWSGGQVPGAGAVIQIVSGTTVVYDIESDANIEALGVNPGGKLEFAIDRDTRLTLTTMIVFEGGHLQIGTESIPLPVNYMAEIVIADVPLDLENDPSQYGNGLILVGTVDIFGNEIDRTWQRLLLQARAGDTQLGFYGAAPAGWKAGDTIILPDTRQVPSRLAIDVLNSEPGVFEGQWEEAVILSIDGDKVNLTAPLQYDHVGAINGNGFNEILPHVAVLDRNIVVRSENPSGTRGHILAGLRADLDIQYARFKDMGRTEALVPLDNTTFDEHGNVTHIGTNQIGRYSFHMHHVIGPEAAPASGYQYRFVGNTIDGGLKWGMAVHNTHYGFIKDNVAYDIHGAAFVTEDGSETGNRYIRNFAMRIVGTGIDGDSGIEENDYGRGGVGFWARRAGNDYEDNVAVNTLYGGIVVAGKLLNSVVIPTEPGVDKTVPGDGIEVINSTPGTFLRNEVYGRSQHGIWISWPTAYRLDRMVETLEIKNSTIWNTFSRGISLDFTNHVVVTGAKILGDLRLLEQNDPARPATGIVAHDHTNLNLVIQDSRIEGMKFGILTPPSDDGAIAGGEPTIVRNTRLQNYINVRVATGTSANGKRVDLENIVWDTLAISPLQDLDPLHVYLMYQPTNTQLLAPDIVRVLDANGDPDADYRLYYQEQLPDFVVPEAGPVIHGSPVPGLTNEQLWEQFGQAIGGDVAPCIDGECLNATTEFVTNGHTFDINIAASISGVSSVLRDEVLSLTLNAIDSASFSQDDFTFHIDWENDGVFDESVVAPSGTTVQRQFYIHGTTTIRVVAENDTGDLSNEATHDVNVVTYQLLPNGEDPQLTDLIWYGTGGTDKAFFVPNATDIWYYEDTINSVVTGEAVTITGVTGTVVAYGFDGNDTLAATLTTRDVVMVGGPGDDLLLGDAGDDFLDGGPGRDYLFSGAGNDVLVGGDGSDLMFAGEGNDILLGQLGNDRLNGEAGSDFLYGGEGEDNLSGGTGEDILIAGTTSYTDGPAGIEFQALAAIYSEWTSSRSYQQRIDNLSGVGSGPNSNGTYYLQPEQNVFGDTHTDLLTGGSESDWFLLTATPGSFEGSPIPVDTIFDLVVSEQTTDAHDAPPWW